MSFAFPNRFWQSLPLFVSILLGFALSSCQEIERVTLLKTVLENQSDTVITMRVVIVDMLPEDRAATYGVCWAEEHVPTINDNIDEHAVDATTHNAEYEFHFREFVSRRTYYFRTFLTLATGEVRYGNVVVVQSGLARGRWRKIAHDISYVVTLLDLEPGSDATIDYHIKETFMFQSLGFFQGELYELTGGQRLTWLLDLEANKYRYAGPSGGDKSSIKRFEDEGWENYMYVPSPGRSPGGINMIEGNFLYFGASIGRSWNAPGYQNYSRSDYESRSDKIFRRIDLQTGIVQELADFPGNRAVFGGHFVIGSKIFFVSGWNHNDKYLNQCWVYDIELGEWNQLNDFPGAGRMHGVAFALNGKGYFGLGFAGIAFHPDEEYYVDYPYPTEPRNDFWEYDPLTDTWTKLTDFPGAARGSAFSFTLQELGYVGCGMSSFNVKYFKDFWRFDPKKKNWTQLDDFPGKPRFAASGCSDNIKGIAGLGYIIPENSPAQIPQYGLPFYNMSETRNIYFPELEADLWEYDPSSN